MDTGYEPERAHWRAIIGGTFVAIAGLLAALALVYTNATGVTQVADDARRQQHAESALGAAASARNAVGQALLLSGSTDDPTLTAAAIAEAESVLAAMEERMVVVADSLADPAGLEDLLTLALSDAAAVLDAVADGDLESAGKVATGASATSFTQLVDRVSTLRNDLAVDIAGAATESGSIATASRFMVAFFVPSVAVAVAFIVAKRRRKRERLAIELDQERALNRSKDQLIANLSHELRTPLTGIYTSALAIEDAGFVDLNLTRELTDVIIDQSADLTRMVEDLLVSAQADAGRLRFDLTPTDFASLIAGLENEFSRLNARIDTAVAPGIVMADPGRLRQLLRNLVSNAAKYGNGRVGVKGRLNGASYTVQVVDDGPGVPEDVKDRMFQRFVHRGDQPLIVGSVGLGLSISKVLAEGMGGRIAYRRTEQFTIFEATLERAEPPAAGLPPDPFPTENPALVHNETHETAR